MAGGGGHKKDFNTVLTRQDKKFFISELFKVIQDAIPLILHYRTMCQFRTISSSTFITWDVQSVYTPSSIRIDTGRKNLGKERQTVFFTAVNPLNKKHKDPYDIDLTAPRLAWYKQKAWKRHSVLGRYTTCSTERIAVLSNKIGRNHPFRHAPILLYPEGFHDGNWRNQIRESICVTSTSSEDFLYRQLDERIGFRSCWR